MKTTIAFLLLVSASRACPDASLCENQDCGSCGNSCCKLEAEIPGYSTEETVAALNGSLAGGGFDGSYTPSETAEGTLGFADLRAYGKPVDFIGQAIHTTPSPYYYNDSISMTIAPSDDSSGSVILAHSISLIAGAYCDAGQNYYNIVALINGAFDDSVIWTNVDGSCADPSA